MPREGVPYPSREICSLKCQIDALNRKIDELMKSVNGVQGDGQGNVSLISGDPALVINNDQVHNEIELTLDPSLLPAAAVSSVNGQTGAVALEAADIPASGGSDVQTELNAHVTDIGNLFNAVGYEATARQNADNALQTNINAVQAGIPAAAAAAVAADPTVAQLASDMPNKLDKITSGSALKAYTHNGATQGEKEIVDGVTADTIGIRDANGRMQAADPASGATDKTLVTANWVSQTGDSAPNNLLHKSGNESRTGELTEKAGSNGSTFTIMSTNIDYSQGPPSSNINSPLLRFVDKDSDFLGFLFMRHLTDNTTEFRIWVRNSDGTTKNILLGKGDVI